MGDMKYLISCEQRLQTNFHDYLAIHRQNNPQFERLVVPPVNLTVHD
jgi:hypothetical protein